MTNSPIDALFGDELDYIRRGLSQLDLILGCKDSRILELDQELVKVKLENTDLKNHISKLRNVVTQLQIQLEQSQTVTINSLDTQTTIENFFATFEQS